MLEDLIDSSISTFPGEIHSVDDVKGLSAVGGRSLEKIKEILATGSLRKNNFERPGLKEILLFQGIYNVGPKIAEDWYLKGYRTIQAIRDDADKLKLTVSFLVYL